MPPLSPSSSPFAPGVDRRLFLTSLLGVAAAAGLSGCAGATAADSESKGSLSAPLSAKVPSGTSLKIASYQNVQQLQFKLAGLTDSNKIPPLASVLDTKLVAGLYRGKTLIWPGT